MFLANQRTTITNQPNRLFVIHHRHHRIDPRSSSSSLCVRLGVCRSAAISCCSTTHSVRLRRRAFSSGFRFRFLNQKVIINSFDFVVDSFRRSAATSTRPAIDSSPRELLFFRVEQFYSPTSHSFTGCERRRDDRRTTSQVLINVILSFIIHHRYGSCLF